MRLPHPILPLLSGIELSSLTLTMGEGSGEPSHLWGRASGDFDLPHPGFSWREERRGQIHAFLPVLCDSGAPPPQPHLLTPERKEAFTIAAQRLPRESVPWEPAAEHGAESLAWGMQGERPPKSVSRGSGRAGLLLCALTPSLPLHSSPAAMNAGLPPQIEGTAATLAKAAGRMRENTGPGRLAWMAPPGLSVTPSLGVSRPRQVSGPRGAGDGTASPKDVRNMAVWLRVPAADRTPEGEHWVPTT